MNLRDLLNQLNISVREAHEHQNIRSGWVGTDCPWCGSVGKYHLGINLDSYWTSCWQCGSHGLASALIKLSGQNPKTVYKLVESLDRWNSRVWEKTTVSGKYTPPKAGPLQPPHKRYLASRGFNPEQLEKIWKLQGIGPFHRLAWRILIPITFRGEAVSWTTRAIGHKGTYRAAGPTEEKIHHKSLLYGEDEAANAIVICEGPADVWRIGPGAVATLGVRTTQEQLIRISRYPIRAICFDNEASAQRRAKRLAAELDAFPGITSIIELDSSDPGSCSAKEVRLIRKSILGET